MNLCNTNHVFSHKQWGLSARIVHVLGVSDISSEAKIGHAKGSVCQLAPFACRLVESYPSNHRAIHVDCLRQRELLCYELVDIQSTRFQGLASSEVKP